MIRTFLLSLVLLVCETAHAGGFAVVPLRLDFAKNRSTSISVINSDEEAKTFEVRVMRWQQKNRVDNYEPSTDIVAAPATFKLERNATQVVRLQLNRARDDSEAAYRVFIDEVPVSREIKANTLKTVVSMAVPAFVAPASGPLAKGQAVLKASFANDVIRVELANSGKANLKLMEWTLSSAKAGPLMKLTSAAYVLAGNTLAVDQPLRIQADGPLKLSVRTDRGVFSTDVAR